MKASLLSWPVWLLLSALLFLQMPVRAMDRVRVETRIDDAVTKYGVTGSNVVVAILDRGLD